jgi:hypothetical protein
MSSTDDSESEASPDKETPKQFEALPFRPPRLRRGSARKADQDQVGHPPTLPSKPTADDPAD